MTCKWNSSDHTEILLTKDDGTYLVLKEGDCVSFEGRECVRLDNFFGKEGPTGITYLPWRGNRWATPLFGMKGDPRFLICRPYGIKHFGEHPNWNSFEKIKNPE